MEQQVIFRDRQELQAQDLNNVEVFADAALGHVITDAITSERQFVGLQIAKKSATELTIDPGRLYSGDEGAVYCLAQKQTLSIFSSLPLMDKRWLAISVMGQETETDIQPRDYLLDLQTGQTEPRAVAMQKERIVQTHITIGLESSDPQKPEHPTGYVLIAYVMLDSSGIQTIEMAGNKILPNLNMVRQSVQDIGSWRTLAEPRISTLSSDIANIASKVNKIQDPASKIFDLAADVARLKEKASLPSTYSSYSADYFVSDAQSDTANVNYSALVKAGLRFPQTAANNSAMQLFNPYETAVKSYQGLLLPANSDEARIKTEGYTGAISVAQYPYQTCQFNLAELALSWRNYGPYWHNSLTNQYIYLYDPTKFYYAGRTYEDKYILLTDIESGYTCWHYPKPYVEFKAADTQSAITVNGSQAAQTFLNAQAGWLTKVGLNFTATDVNGVVNVHITECIDGKPDPSKCIGYSSLNPSDLKKYPQETTFALQRPAYLKAGTRYAIVITTAGNHTLAGVEGSRYTQGSVFYKGNNDYLQSDLNKDLLMSLYFAKFASAFTQIQLQPMSLSGGIANISLMAGMVIPDACSLLFEYQKDGNWIKIGANTSDQLLGLPALLPLRATFIGSSDIMPALDLSNSSLSVSRANTAFRHISTTRTLGANTSQVDVQLEIDNWEAANHTCTIRLIANGNTINASQVTDVSLGTNMLKRTARFAVSPAANNYKVEILGSTTSAISCFYVVDRVDIAY